MGPLVVVGMDGSLISVVVEEFLVVFDVIV